MTKQNRLRLLNNAVKDKSSRAERELDVPALLNALAQAEGETDEYYRRSLLTLRATLQEEGEQ